MKNKITYRLTVGAERSAYVGRPGSTKYLFPVFLDGKPEMQVGPKNSFGLTPGMDMQVTVLRDDFGNVLQFQAA